MGNGKRDIIAAGRQAADKTIMPVLGGAMAKFQGI